MLVGAAKLPLASESCAVYVFPAKVPVDVNATVPVAVAVQVGRENGGLLT